MEEPFAFKLPQIQAITEMAVEFLVNYSFQVLGTHIFKLIKKASFITPFPQLNAHQKSS